MKIISLGGRVFEDAFEAETYKGQNKTVLGNKVWMGSIDRYTPETKIAIKKRIKKLYPSVVFYPKVAGLCFTFNDSTEEAQFTLLSGTLEIDCREPL